MEDWATNRRVNWEPRKLLTFRSSPQSIACSLPEARSGAVRRVRPAERTIPAERAGAGHGGGKESGAYGPQLTAWGYSPLIVRLLGCPP